MSNHLFQVNLEGIIKLLSDSLYAEERVFIRELLQNAQDAIQVRKRFSAEELSYRIDIRILVENQQRVLEIRDNGSGLTEEEIHQFLATIGMSSKSKDDQPIEDVIGQFGIGLLSGFMVSSEIEMITRSMKGGDPMRWIGNQDGSYVLETYEGEAEIGSVIRLRPKAGQESFFTLGELETNIVHFADLLPIPIYLSEEGGVPRQINRAALPWENISSEYWQRDLKDYGNEVFKKDFADVFLLYEEPDGTGEVIGAGFVVPYQGTGRPPSRVYLKRMLLTDKETDLLPKWAFFVQVVINSKVLSPTASRETIYPNDELDELKASIDEQLRSYIEEKLVKEPVLRDHLLSNHLASILSLANENRTFFNSIYPMLPVHTNRGPMTFGEFIQDNNPAYYTNSEELMGQLETMANSHGMLVLKSYTNLAGEFLNRYTKSHPEQKTHLITQADILNLMGQEIELDSKEEIFLEFAETALDEFSVTCEFREFDDASMVSLYIPESSNKLLRLAQLNKAESTSAFSQALDISLMSANSGQRLCFNHQNPLISNMLDRYSIHPDGIAHCIRIVYVQALLSSRIPLSDREVRVLSEGMEFYLSLLDQEK